MAVYAALSCFVPSSDTTRGFADVGAKLRKVCSRGFLSVCRGAQFRKRSSKCHRLGSWGRNTQNLLRSWYLHSMRKDNSVSPPSYEVANRSSCLLYTSDAADEED